jgi:L-ascorbate metabolism protein UlaG (beta-lactamase superfamily)
MKITLLSHSGFLIEGEKTCLVFDYFTDELNLLGNLALGERKLVFFASHSHHDHYNKKIFKFAKPGSTGYVLGRGIAKERGQDAVVLDKGQSAELMGVKAKAFGSTDEGVSFLVEMEGRKIFHAGDLNDWYWEEESTPEELQHDEKWFQDEVAPLSGASPEVAFLPVDARLGKHALRGPLYFAREMSPALIVPMHLCGGEGLPLELKQALANERINTGVANIVHPGDHIEL